MNRERRDRTRAEWAVVAVVAVAGLSACGGTDELPSTVGTGGTVALGDIPDPLSNAPTVPPPSSPTPATTVASTAPPERIEGAISEAVAGDRLLFIGDSLLASMSPNDNARLCDVTASFGWEVEIDSQSEATIDFANTVIDARVPDAASADAPAEGEALDDWDVVALVFGSEVDGADDEAVAEFGEGLDAVVARLAPRPTILYTVTEANASRSAMNDAIREVVEKRPNTVLIDFAELGGPADEVLEDEGRRFNEDGRKRFSVLTVASLAEAPGGTDGRCLGAVFDDSNSD